MSGWKNRAANIYLIGPRASGKSTLAVEISSRTALKAVDADRLLEGEQGQNISTLVAARGWEHFRDLEEEILSRIAAADKQVVATGGGIVLRQKNRSLLKKGDGLTVYLFADASLMLQRLKHDPLPDQRPPLSRHALEEEVHKTLAERDHLYRECADIILPAGLAVEVLVERIIRKYAGS